MRKIMVLIMSLMVGSAFAASTHLSLDNRTGTRVAAATERICFSPAWETDAAGATAVVSVNGEVVKSATDAGVYEWTPSQDGTYELTHAVFVNGVRVGEALTATFVAVRIPAAPAASDVLFVASSPTGYKPSNGGVVVRVPIGRYFGDINRLVKSGAMASQVVLEVMQTKDIPVDASVVLNGVRLAGGYNCSTSATDGERWNRVRYSVDVGALKVPVNRGAEVANTVEIVFDEGTGRETVAWAALYIPVAPPVVLAHGINSSASQLGKLKDEIEWLGMPTISGDFDNNGNNAISDIADLTRLVDQAKRDFGVETVNIVGHSMGGLRAREYVQRHKQAKDVMKVLQVASPNGGSPVADFVVDMKQSYELAYYNRFRDGKTPVFDLVNEGFVDWSLRGSSAMRGLAKAAGMDLDPFTDEAIESLMTRSMKAYNQKNLLVGGVEYGVVAGCVTEGGLLDVLNWMASPHDSSHWTLKDYVYGMVVGLGLQHVSKIGPVKELLTIPDVSKYLEKNFWSFLFGFKLDWGDMIVPVSSAFTLVPPLGEELKGPFDEVWHSGLISNGVKRTMALLTPKLIDHKTCAYGEDVASRKMLKASPLLLATGSQIDNEADESLLMSSTNGMSLVSGVLDSNTNYTVNVGVCVGNLSVFAFQQTGTCIDMDCVELYDPSGRRVVESKDVFMTNDESCVFCVLRNPAVGNWQLKFSTGDYDGEDLWTLAFHEVDSPVVVEVEMAKSEIVVDDAFELTVCAKNGKAPLYGTVDVMMTSPSGECSRKEATSIGGGRYRCNLVAKEIGEYSFGVQFNTANPLAISRLLSFGACAVEGSSDNKITYLPGEQCDGEPVEQEKPSGVAVKLRGPTFLRENCLQIGWIDSRGSGQTYAFGEYYTNDVDLTLLPVWKQRQDAVSHALGFDEGSVEISGEGQWLPESGGSVVRGSILSGLDNAETSLSVTVEGGGVLSFKIKTSCESSLNATDGLRDYAEFLVDGEVVATSDGESVWKEVSVELSGGTSHTVTWRYVKDGSGSEGEDCVWLSDIQFSAITDEETLDGLLDESEYNWFYENGLNTLASNESYEYVPETMHPEDAVVRMDMEVKLYASSKEDIEAEAPRDLQGGIVASSSYNYCYYCLTADGWIDLWNFEVEKGLDGYAPETSVVSMIFDYSKVPSRVKYLINGHTLTNALGESSFICAVQKPLVEALQLDSCGENNNYALGGLYDVLNSDLFSVAEGDEIISDGGLDDLSKSTVQVTGGGTLVIPGNVVPDGGIGKDLHVDANSKLVFDYSQMESLPSHISLFNGVGSRFLLGDNIRFIVPGEGVDRVSKLFVKNGVLEARVAERPTIDDVDGSDSAFTVNAEGDSTAVSASVGNAVEGFWYGLFTTGMLTSDFVLDPDSVKQCTGTGPLRLESSANANSDSGFYRVSVSAEKP